MTMLSCYVARYSLITTYFSLIYPAGASMRAADRVEAGSRQHDASASGYIIIASEPEITSPETCCRLIIT